MGENKNNSNQRPLLLAITVLLSLILLISVFKVGVVIGSKHTYQKNIRGHQGYEFKNSIMIKRESTYEAFKLKAQDAGMTVEEYKASLLEQKK